jgi:hypothetical protein
MTPSDLDTLRDVFEGAHLKFVERENSFDDPEGRTLFGTLIEFRGRFHTARFTFGLDGNLMDVEGVAPEVK